MTDKVITRTKEALLENERPSEYFEKLRKSGEIAEYFPELANLIGVPQNKAHHREGDAWTHTMLVTDEAAKKRSIVENPLGFMLSALCHDLGKAVCTEEINGIIHAYRHETEGLPLVRRFMERMTDNTALTDYVLNMTELHMLPNMMAKMQSAKKKTNKLYDKSVDPFGLIQLSVCDGLGKIPSINDSEEFLIERLEYFNETMKKPYVTEKDLIESGLEQNGYFQEIIAYAHKLRLAGIEKESALKQTVSYARKINRHNN